MPMSASAVAALAGGLQSAFKNREMIRAAALCGFLNAIVKMCWSSFTLSYFTSGLNVEIGKLNFQCFHIKIIVL